MPWVALALLPDVARAQGAADPPADLPADLPALAALEAEGAVVAGLVVDLDRGRPLAARAPDLALIPASTVKLATASLALETWGPSHRLATAVLRRGPLEAGVLRGDLVLRGGGDATLTEADFRQMAEGLAQRGLLRVEGDLVVDESLFGRLPCTVEDRCAAEAGSRHAFDAPLSALPVGYNALALTVIGGAREGEPALLLPQPFAVPGLGVEGEVATAAGPAQLALERTSAAGENRLLVSGRMPPGESLTLYRSLADPALHAGRLFRALLERAGVVVAGQVRVSYRPVDAARPLYEHRGAELARALELMLTYSNNMLADTLALGLQRRLRPQQAPALAAAGALLAGHVAGAAVGSAFPGPTDGPAPLLFDGSGLDPADRITARQLVQLLERNYRRAATFPALLGALTVPASGPQRSLRAGEPEWDERIAVKTGGLSEPVAVTTLAGYFRFRDGGWGAFAFLVNGAPDRPLSRGAAFSAMRRDLTGHWLR